MANGAIYETDGEIIRIHDRKLDALEDIIEAANGKPLLVAYWFKHDLQRISERLQNYISRSELLDAASIRRWNNGELPVALIHPASAGHGLNLQSGGSAHRVVRADLVAGALPADQRATLAAGADF